MPTRWYSESEVDKCKIALIPFAYCGRRQNAAQKVLKATISVSCEENVKTECLLLAENFGVWPLGPTQTRQRKGNEGPQSRAAVLLFAPLLPTRYAFRSLVGRRCPWSSVPVPLVATCVADASASRFRLLISRPGLSWADSILALWPNIQSDPLRII